jgi:molecular chaperone DnaJ
MSIPAGTWSGSTLRLRGKGMPELRRKGVGDELVKVNVQLPRRPTPRQRELYGSVREERSRPSEPFAP